MPRPQLVLTVYVVTSAGNPPGRGHAEVAAAAVAGGANVVQLRAPEYDDDQLLPLATELAAACGGKGVLFLVNDRLELAKAAGAAGVHLGQGDDWRTARERLGPDLVLGISVDTAEQAKEAAEAGADYLGVTVWPTATKPEAAAQGLDRIGEVAQASGLPVVGIGGIDAGNAKQVLDAGAAGVAVISAVGAAPDPAAATRELVRAVRGTSR